MTAADLAARTGASPERPSARARIRIAVALILIYAGASTLHWLDRAAEWPARSAQDEISAYQRRLEVLRPALPARGVVGYLGDPEPTGAGALQHFRRYLLAQYSLAPVLLIESAEPDLVVGNFLPGATPAPPAGFQLVRDFGDGLVLFRRSGP